MTLEQQQELIAFIEALEIEDALIQTLAMGELVK